LMALHPANQRRLLQTWLRRHWGRNLSAHDLAHLLSRLSRKQGPGKQDLTMGWQLHWNGCRLTLIPPCAFLNRSWRAP
jgi:hypothetical protein